MKYRRWSFSFVGLIAVALFINASGVIAQKPGGKDEKKQDEAQKKETQNVVKFVDDVAAGQPPPNDLSVAWVREDLLKAQGNKQYVPFTVSLDGSKVTGGTVAFYWRVVAKGGTAPAAAPDAAAQKKPGNDDKKDKDKKKSDFAYEDISFVPVPSGPGPMKVSRSFTVPAGSYDVFVVAKEPTPDKAPKNVAAPKVSVLKETVTVPDFWNGELNTSSV